MTDTDTRKRLFVRTLLKLAAYYGVEDVKPREIIYAVEARESRGETPAQIARFLWGEYRADHEG